jgi:ankyrin repeat protein
VVSALIAAGADKNAHGVGGDTALICAAYNGNYGTVAALVDAGADLRLKNSNGTDALNAARHANPSANPDLVVSIISLLRSLIK